MRRLASHSSHAAAARRAAAAGASTAVPLPPTAAARRPLPLLAPPRLGVMRALASAAAAGSDNKGTLAEPQVSQRGLFVWGWWWWWIELAAGD